METWHGDTHRDRFVLHPLFRPSSLPPSSHPCLIPAMSSPCPVPLFWRLFRKEVSEVVGGGFLRVLCESLPVLQCML